MRIFLSSQQALRRHKVPGYSFWETYFKKGIEEAGHTWIEATDTDWAEGLVYFAADELQKWRDRTWNRVLSDIKQQHKIKPIDLFLSYLFPKQVEPSAIKEIQALGIPCVNFFCDNVRELTKIPQPFHCFDLHWVPEFKALKMYQQAKLNYIYAPMPVWIPPEQRKWSHPENYGVSFIGSRDVQREKLLAEVLKLGIEVEIRGAAWSKDLSSSSPSSNLSIPQTIINQVEMISSQGVNPWVNKIQSKFRPGVPDDVFAEFVKRKPDANEYVSIIQQSIITLGINRYPSFRHSFSNPDTYSRMRDIEAPMMGACYLTEWTQGLEDLYELGEEIETYRTSEEMVEKIKRLKADSNTRNKLRFNGQKRVFTNHTVAHSITKIATFLNIHVGLKRS
jgi:hypothetical protein